MAPDRSSKRQPGLCSVVLSLSLLGAAGQALAAPAVDTFVLTVGGQSAPVDPNPPQFACSTYGPPPPAAMFGSEGISMPVEGYPACSIAGGYRTLAAASGPVADSTGLDTDFHNADNDHFTGSADARADYGVIGAAAFGRFVATPGLSAQIVEGAEAFGHFQDTWTISSPSEAAGAQGWILLTFTVDGRISVSGTSVARMVLDYQQNGGPLTTLLAAGMAGSGDEPFISAPYSFGSHTGPGTWGGFTLAADSLAGSGDFTSYYLPIVFGTPFDIGAVIFAYSIPYATRTASIDFDSTVRLTGIQVLDGSFLPVATFAVASGSGTSYDAAGAHPPPDPFAVVTRSGSPVPGGTEFFASIPQGPSVGATRSGFLGLGTAGQQGVYAGGSGGPNPPPIKVADLATAIPGGTGNFTGFGGLSLTASPVASPQPPPIRLAFLGSGTAQQGLYLGDVTDPTGAIPPTPIKVADLGTSVPGGAGTFTGFGGVSLATLPVAPQPPPISVGFLGDGAGQQGVYLSDVTDPTGAIPPNPIKVADLGASIPAGTGEFTGFDQLAATINPVSGPEGPPIRLAFIGTGDGQQGVYLYDVTDPTGAIPPTPIRVADLSTAIPGGVGTFTGFSALSVSHEHTAFLGQGSGGQAGIYVASTLSKVTAVGDTLEGKVVTALRLGREGLDGDRLGFAADFADGSEGVFSYSLPPSAADTGPGSVGDSLRIAPSNVTPGNLTLSWSASCSANALGYAVYEGEIGHWYSHVPRSCSASGPGLTEELTLSPGNRYYLVVSLGVNGEGSYGRDSNGTELPAAAGGACMATRVIGPCP